MTNASSKTGGETAKTIAFWVLKVALALMFLGAGGFKLSGQPAAVSEFDTVGLGQWFRYFTAIVEVAGALLLLWPRTTFYGAILMGIITIGAFVAQLVVLHGDIFHTIVFTAIFAAIAWAHRDQVATGSFKAVPQS